ncbi:nucleotidyltransferase domain-containing protein [Candidatus Bipolaricaulota bacterium]|nr:nucleotidyltransferase domain-containing protein [Candidatus Bipolaricaulota bacterium]
MSRRISWLACFPAPRSPAGTWPDEWHQPRVIFGSIAKGTAEEKSDVDVLIMGDTPFPDLAAALMAAKQRLGRGGGPTLSRRTSSEND